MICFFSQKTDSVVNFMIKLPVDLTGIPQFIIRVRLLCFIFDSRETELKNNYYTKYWCDIFNNFAYVTTIEIYH